MSALDKVLKFAGVEPEPDPDAALHEVDSLLSLAVSIGTETGMTPADLANVTWALAGSSDDDDSDSDSGPGSSSKKSGDGDSDDDDEDDVTKDPLYKKMVAKGMSPTVAAAMVKNKNKKKRSDSGSSGKKPNPFAKKSS